MKLLLSCLLSLIFTYGAFSQHRHYFSVTFGAGPSYFFNDASLKRTIDNTRFAGINYTLKSKNQAICLNPSVILGTNAYHAVVSQYRRVNVEQNILGLNFDVLLKLRKHLLLRTGLLCQYLISSDVSISDKGMGSGTYFYGNNELWKPYQPAKLQAGFTLGLSFPFKLFRREQKFNIKYIHIASPVVANDYYLSMAAVGSDFKVLSRKAQASMFTLGFDISLERVKKKKKEEEE